MTALEPIEPTAIEEAAETDEQHLARILKYASDDIARRQRILRESEALLRPLSRHLRERTHLNDDGFDIFNCTHDDAIEAMRMLGGGRWQKSVNHCTSTCIDYTCRISGLKIIIWGAQPPGTCRIVEETAEVPAHKVTTRRLICSPEEAIA